MILNSDSTFDNLKWFLIFLFSVRAFRWWYSKKDIYTQSVFHFIRYFYTTFRSDKMREICKVFARRDVRLVRLFWISHLTISVNNFHRNIKTLDRLNFSLQWLATADTSTHITCTLTPCKPAHESLLVSNPIFPGSDYAQIEDHCSFNQPLYILILEVSCNQHLGRPHISYNNCSSKEFYEVQMSCNRKFIGISESFFPFPRKKIIFLLKTSQERRHYHSRLKNISIIFHVVSSGGRSRSIIEHSFSVRCHQKSSKTFASLSVTGSISSSSSEYSWKLDVSPAEVTFGTNGAFNFLW